MSDADRIDAVFGMTAGTASVLESLIEMLMTRGVLPPQLVIEVIDQAMLWAEEQPVSAGYSDVTKVAQIAFLRSLLERIKDHPSTPARPPEGGTA